MSPSNGGKSEHAIAPCPLLSTLAYYYNDHWDTQVHQFAKFDDKRAGQGGFVTGKPEYLVGGSGQTEAARVSHGVNGTEYDARIYSHFSAGVISTIVGAPSKGSPDKEGHKRTDIEKRRFIARAIELETYLYLDSLRHWTLTTFAMACKKSQDCEAQSEGSASPTRDKPSTREAPRALELWLEEKRRRWSNAPTKAPATGPQAGAPEHESASRLSSLEVVAPQSQSENSSWWSKREELHQVFESFASGGIKDMEATLQVLVPLVKDPSNLLKIKVPEKDKSNRFWAEGLCETVRETTLIPTVFPQLMEALICNIPATFWVNASTETGDMPLRIMARAAASLVYKLNAALHFDPEKTDDKPFDALLTSLVMPMEGSSTLHTLVARIENINDLIALHAAALHDCFTDKKTIVIKPKKHASEERAVDGVRPKTPTRVFCFKSPNTSNDCEKKQDGKQDETSPPDGCAGCFEKRCSLLPCESEECHAAATGNREFVRQLREQQAALNGTPRARLHANREFVAPKRSLDAKSGALVARTDPSAPSADPLGNSPPETAGEGGTDQVRDTGAQRRASERWLALRSEQLEKQGLSKDDAKAAALAERTSELRRIERSLREQAIADRVGHLRASGIPESDLEATARCDIKKAREERVAEEMRAIRTQHTGISDTECRKLARRKIREETMGELLESGYQGLAALHALDIIAGGHAFQLLGLGDGSVNSAIGRQWTSTPGKKLAEALANGPAHEEEIYPNFELVVCPRPCPANPNNKKTATPSTP